MWMRCGGTDGGRTSSLCAWFAESGVAFSVNMLSSTRNMLPHPLATDERDLV